MKFNSYLNKKMPEIKRTSSYFYILKCFLPLYVIIVVLFFILFLVNNISFTLLLQLVIGLLVCFMFIPIIVKIGERHISFFIGFFAVICLLLYAAQMYADKTYTLYFLNNYLCQNKSFSFIYFFTSENIKNYSKKLVIQLETIGMYENTCAPLLNTKNIDSDHILKLKELKMMITADIEKFKNELDFLQDQNIRESEIEKIIKLKYDDLLLKIENKIYLASEF